MGRAAMPRILLGLAVGLCGFAQCAGWCENLLSNPGFESGVVAWNQVYGLVEDAYGWRWCAAANSSGFWNGATTAWGGGTTVRTGSYCVRVFHYGPIYGYPEGWRTATISQVVEVNSDQDYVASAWVFIYLAPGASLGSEFAAGLVVEELDVNGAIVATHQQMMTDAADVWRELSLSLHTASTTARVRYTLYQHWYETESINHINWDDCAFVGEPSRAGIVQGAVTSGGNAVAGAKVSVNGLETTTDASGCYSVRCSQDTSSVVVRVSKAGYFAQIKYRTIVDGPNTVDFDLVAKGDNLIANAGFDDGPYGGGWVGYDYGSGYRRGEWEAQYCLGSTPSYYSGENAICLFVLSPPSGFWYYQDISVLGGTQYTAGVRTKINKASGTSTKWGNLTDAQVAGLLIYEYDAAGALVFAHPLVKSQELFTWEQLSYTFTTQPTTRTVRIGPYIWSLEDASKNGSWRRATFDDVELRGPAGQVSLSGTVTCGQKPVAGARITLLEKDGQKTSCVTDSSGHYSAAVTYGSTYTLQVSSAGCVTQTKEVTATVPLIVDFELTAVGANLLFNPNFDDPAGWLSGGWQTTGPASVFAETANLEFGQVCVDTPSQAVCIRGPNAAGRVFQDVRIRPGMTYTASCRFRPTTDARYGSVWGTNSNQIGALFVQQYDAAMQPIGVEQRVQAYVTTANRDKWQTLKLSFTASPATAYARVGGYAYLVDDYDSNLARATFDTFRLDGAAAPGTSVGLAKRMTDGQSVSLVGKITTACFNGYFYIEEPDRSSGIRVIGEAEAGENVDVQGCVTTIDGERAIAAAGVIRRGLAAVPRPLGMTIRSIKSGLSPVGLYVTVCGTVVDRRIGYYLLDDGSGTYLKVYGSAAVGAFVRATGALGAEMSGTQTVPVLRAVQTVTVQTGGTTQPGPINAGLLMDETCRSQANAVGKNYWWAYSSEILDRLGLRAAIISTDQLAQTLPNLSILMVGPMEAAKLDSSMIGTLDSWVRSGGVLIACAPQTLDELMGNQLVSYDAREGDDFGVSSEFHFSDSVFTYGIHTPLHPNSPLVSIGPVRRVAPVRSTALALSGDDAVITARKYGYGWAFYFGFDLAHTFWAIQQGRPIDADYDGDGYWRTGDAQILRSYEPEVPYTDELLFLLRNMVAVKPMPLLDQLPPSGGSIPDALIFYGGDDECGSGVQVPASAFMHSRGLPYHINCMPLNGVFGLSLEEAQTCYANGTELSIHYDFVDGFLHPGGFSPMDVYYQTTLFRNYFGYTPISSVNHCVRWTGWAEPAEWMMQAGLKGDNSHFPVPLVTSNPTNCFGFGFGTAFPYFFYTDYRQANSRLDFVELPISGYELGYSGNIVVSPQIERALYTASYYHLTFNFFYHPVYIAYYQGCRDAIDTLLDLIYQQGLNVVHTTPDALTLWWMDRNRISISNVQFGATRMSFDVINPTTRSCIVRIPLGDYEAVNVSYPHNVSDEFGVRWLKMVLPGGSQHVELSLQAVQKLRRVR